jgi:hypothetical protein
MRDCVLVASAVPTIATAEATEDVRWRAFDQGDGALLAISDGDEATDHFGLPLLSCKKGIGVVEIQGEAKERLRIAMANLIRGDKTPLVWVLPDAKSEANMKTIELFIHLCRRMGLQARSDRRSRRISASEPRGRSRLYRWRGK